MAEHKGIILLVEDEGHLRQGIQDYLARRGYELHAAENGKRALALLAEISVDVILTDMRMKGLSNIPLDNALQEKSPEVQIIVMTAYGSVLQAVKTMKCCVYDYFSKPLD